ncbi:MAG: xanthine dehydrogenase family protein molybdopterin-binding subunit, partial [Acidobacteriaceae bacterium]|nr:xanthine dehydrogenase family protein molybdopterin-binding subunit [Acidobacteriaceae bacterium]
AAAKAWQVPASECVARASVVSHPSTNRCATYGSLALAASRISLPGDAIPLKPATSNRLLGKPVSGVDNLDIVMGRPLFGMDVSRPNMRYAAIARCPSGARLVSYDDRQARAFRGVHNVIRIDGLERCTWLRSGVAVVADCTWTAIKARNALHVVWDKAPEGALRSEDISARLRKSALEPGTCLRHAGDVEAALQQASHNVDAEYELPLVAHVPMEPMNCTAHVSTGRCDVWGPIQMPDSACTNVARAIGLPKEAIAIHPTRIGGSFGRRLASDYAAEAAYISKAIGDPVQVIWTREDDLEHDFYRPAAYHHIRAGMSGDGEVVAWRHRICSLADSMYPTSTGAAGLIAPRSSDLRADLNDDLVPCLIANYLLEVSNPKLPVETGSLRAPGNHANAFVVNSVLDELAHASGIDPVKLRMRLLGTKSDFPYKGPYRSSIYNPDRLKAVIMRAAEISDWNQALPPRCGRGIAAHYTNGSCAAHVIEVEVNVNLEIRFRRVIAVIDCGIVVNRSGVDAQAQGGTIDALSAAMFGEVILENGRAKQLNFDSYRWIRNKETPQVEIMIMESDEEPTGIGEIPYPPVAPALTNAIFQATGQRIRRLPLARFGYKLAT